MFELTAPATNAAAIITGSGTPTAMTRRQPPKHRGAGEHHEPVARNASRRGYRPEHDPSANPTGSADDRELSPRSIVM
jgi:hypothetical protein